LAEPAFRLIMVAEEAQATLEEPEQADQGEQPEVAAAADEEQLTAALVEMEMLLAAEGVVERLIVVMAVMARQAELLFGGDSVFRHVFY